MKHIILLVSLFSILFVACKQDNPVSVDDLEATGILGKWEIQSRSANGITDLSIQCCEFLEFSKDSQADDLIGQCMASGLGYEKSGDFELDLENNTVLFELGDDQKLYSVQIQENTLTFDYQEDGVDKVETWVKRD